MAVDRDFEQRIDTQRKKSRRKLAGEGTQALHVVLRSRYYHALELLAGSNSFGYELERLIHREVKRKDKKRLGVVVSPIVL